MTSRPRITAITLAAVAALALAACGGSDDATPQPAVDDTVDEVELGPSGIRIVTASEGAAIANDPPDGLVVLDVRTPQEFAEGHLDGAVMLDFYRDDFAEQLAQLDPNVPYLLYCRSGNRSGQTAALMAELGFTDVADVDGGILAWADGGLPIVTE